MGAVGRAVAERLESYKLQMIYCDRERLCECDERAKRLPRCLIQYRAQTLFTPQLRSAIEDVRRQIELRAASNILQAVRGETPSDAGNSPALVDRKAQGTFTG